MKTAKEWCEEHQNKEINYIIDNYVIATKDSYLIDDSYIIKLIEKHSNKLTELGYKIEFKTIEFEILKTKFLFFTEIKKIKRNGYIITACCGDE